MKKRRLLVILIAILILIQGMGVSARVITREETDTGTGQSASVVDYALKWVGNENIPYVWGGGRGLGVTLESLAEKPKTGTDCSGYVSLVFAHFGISIPNQSELIYQSAKKVFYDQSQAAPGDLCWWDGHIAIYIGNNKIVHTNTKVKPNNLIHVTELGKDYPNPSAYLRVVDDVKQLGNVTSALEEQVKNIKSSGAIATESDLTGMPTKSSLAFEQKQLSLKSRDDLSQLDQKRLDYLKDSLENKQVTFTDRLYTSVMLIGLLLAVYCVFLLVAVIFDFTNSFIDMSLVKILTFGKWQVISKEEYLDGDYGRKGYSKEFGYSALTIGMICVRLLVMMLISYSLISGLVLNLIVYFLGKFL